MIFGVFTFSAQSTQQRAGGGRSDLWFSGIEWSKHNQNIKDHISGSVQDRVVQAQLKYQGSYIWFSTGQSGPSTTKISRIIYLVQYRIGWYRHNYNIKDYISGSVQDRVVQTLLEYQGLYIWLRVQDRVVQTLLEYQGLYIWFSAGQGGTDTTRILSIIYVYSSVQDRVVQTQLEYQVSHIYSSVQDRVVQALLEDQGSCLQFCTGQGGTDTTRISRIIYIVQYSIGWYRHYQNIKDYISG